MSDVLVDFELSYPVYFEEKGSISFKYRMDSSALISEVGFSYSDFQLIIDDTPQYEDHGTGSNTGWQEVVRDEIPIGYHSIVWRYTKLNMKPLTEFLEAEI